MFEGGLEGIMFEGGLEWTQNDVDDGIAWMAYLGLIAGSLVIKRGGGFRLRSSRVKMRRCWIPCCRPPRIFCCRCCRRSSQGPGQGTLPSQGLVQEPGDRILDNLRADLQAERRERVQGHVRADLQAGGRERVRGHVKARNAKYVELQLCKLPSQGGKLARTVF